MWYSGYHSHSTVPTHQEVCPLQQVECEYKQFGCAVVLPRKDIGERLKTSVQDHLYMTKRRVEEQEVHLRVQEIHLQEQDMYLLKQEVHLQGQEECLQKMETILIHSAIGIQSQQ